MQLGVVGVRIALSITRIGESLRGNRQEDGKGGVYSKCLGKVCLMTKLATAVLSGDALSALPHLAPSKRCSSSNI
jgi:hypothetical protein